MAENAKYITLDDDNFQEEILNSDLPVLVFVWSALGVVSKSTEPMIEELALEYEGRVKVVKLDADKNPRAVRVFAIKQTPTFLFVNVAGKLADRLDGGAWKEELVEKLDTLVQQPIEIDQLLEI